jgi:hypothetical protein
MGTFEIFVIRLILSVVIAVLICRFFFQETPLIKVFGLALIMMGLAYILEYLKRRKKGGIHGS